MNMEVDLDGLFRQNGTYDYMDYEYKEDFVPRASGAVLFPVLYSLELVVGLLGNGLLLAVLAQKRRSWTTSDTFVLHLSVADVLLLVTLPFWAAQAAQLHGWCFGGFLCKISGALFNINFYCGIFLLLCISLDRYLSMARATQLYSPEKPRLAHISCLSIWLVSLFLTIPDCIFLMASYDPAQDITLCEHSYSQALTDWQLVSRLLHHTLGFLLPAVALIICCAGILLQLQRTSESVKTCRAAVLTLTLVLVFFLCWMPYNITLIVDTVRSRSEDPDGLSGNPQRSLKGAQMVTSALGCTHACLRPLLYLGLCRNFRKRTLGMLKGATVETESSLWEMGVGEQAPPDKNHEGVALNQMSDQVQSPQC